MSRQDAEIKAILRKEKGKGLSEIIEKYPNEFSSLLTDEESRAHLLSLYKDTISSPKSEPAPPPPERPSPRQRASTSPKPKDNAVQDKTEELLSQVTTAIQEQQKIILDQQKKIQEQDQKLNDVVGVIQSFISNPQAVLGALGQGEGQTGATAPASEAPNQPGAGEQPQASPTAGPPSFPTPQGTAGSPFDFNRIQDVLKSIAVITSNMGGPQQQAAPQDIVGNITSSVEVATHIASSIGEGLGKLFDSFNKMQDRAYRSWAVKSKTGLPESEIENMIEKKLEKVASKVYNRSSENT